jgi:hypothetical protein
LLAIGILSMACGTWLGLLRLGWRLPLPWPDQLIAHGPLMVCGFLGTLISVERAVALGRPWAYTAPILTAAGALALDLSVPSLAPALITAGSAALVLVFFVLLRRQATLYMSTMALGAIAWLAGNALWLDAFAIYRVVPWWIAFLVLTIAGERLELNRVLRPTTPVRVAFALAVAVLLAGVVVSLRDAAVGVRIVGAGLLALAAWLARYDIARRTVRLAGLTRYMAVGLLVGYAWLAIGGLLAILAGDPRPGLLYDARLHAIFLGFVMSMVFSHAPVIFPAVLGAPLPYGSRFYAHLAVLHASVALRLAGDLAEPLARCRAWGGLLNAAALAIFVANVAGSALLSPETFRPVRGSSR